jgi:hypothetical protein
MSYNNNVLDILYEYANQLTKTKVNIKLLLEYICYIDNVSDNHFILLPTIINYIRNQQLEYIKPLDYEYIMKLSNDEQIAAIANFAAIKYLNMKKTIESLNPFIKQWELFCISGISNRSDEIKTKILYSFTKLYEICDTFR